MFTRRPGAAVAMFDSMHVAREACSEQTGETNLWELRLSLRYLEFCLFGHWDRLVNKTNCELFVFIKVHSMFPLTFTSQQIQTFRCGKPNHTIC